MTHTLPPGWEEKTLGELCDVLDFRRKPITQKDRTSGPYSYYGATGIVDFVDSFLFDEPLLLVGEDGARWGAGYPCAFIASGKYWVNNHAHVLKPKNLMSIQYLVYFLNYSDLTPYITGTTVPKLNQQKLRSISVSSPSLPEQKRIVEKLDKIFAAIDKAKSQTEKNLQNAKALFNIYLNSLSYSTKKLGELVRITTGKLNANAQEKNGKYPFFTCSREILYINTYAFDCEAILLAGNNASADFNVKYYKGKFNAYQRTYVITIQDTYKLSYKYLYFQLIKELSQLKKIAVGANTRFLRLGMIKDINLALPPLEKQQQIVSCLDSLYAKTQELEKIYIQKLADLEELKQSVLQQAFSGKL